MAVVKKSGPKRKLWKKPINGTLLKAYIYKSILRGGFYDKVDRRAIHGLFGS